MILASVESEAFGRSYRAWCASCRGIHCSREGSSAICDCVTELFSTNRQSSRGKNRKNRSDRQHKLEFNLEVFHAPIVWWIVKRRREWWLMTFTTMSGLLGSRIYSGIHLQSSVKFLVEEWGERVGWWVSELLHSTEMRKKVKEMHKWSQIFWKQKRQSGLDLVGWGWVGLVGIGL